MNVLWLDVPPHTFWGWVLELGLGLGALWFIGFWIVVLIGFLLNCLDESDGSAPRANPSHSAIAAQERTEARRAARVIDEVYDRAEEEVKHLAR